MARSDAVPVAQQAAKRAWMDPLDAYRRLRAAGAQPILLASAGAHPEARLSFIACHPASELRVEGDTVVETMASGAVEARTQPPLEAVRELAHRYALPREDHPFTGGWVGLLGFAFARAIEPTLPPSPAADAPDAVFWLCPDAIVFDHAAASLTAYAADLEGSPEAAASRLERLLAVLDGAAPGIAPPTSLAPDVSPEGADEPWRPSLDAAAFERRVEAMKRLIHDGDMFQANLATRWQAPRSRADCADLFEALRAANPSPFMALVESEAATLVSGSPEQLLRVRDGRIESRPIAGTRKRGASPAEDEAMARELREDAKEQAEHTMLVDLVRNDIAKVAVPGTVRIAETGSVERYRHVMHLASLVEAQVRPGTDLADWLGALFPGGTITGAPKVRATQRILEAEPVARGFYTGSLGYLSWSGNADWNILIRTLQLGRHKMEVHAGSGIVADSDAPREWKEAQRKAQALRDLAGAGASATQGPAPMDRLGEVQRAPPWRPPVVAARHRGKRVLLVDNYDSFVHNLADYLSTLGAQVRVIRNDVAWRPVVDGFRPTHVVLSPGPGWPSEAGATLEIARALHGKVPILGVCLGHQAIGEAHGGRVVRHASGPVHGKADDIMHGAAGLFAGLPSPLRATRYHSLVVVADAMEGWVVDARLADGTVMALRHREAPTFGLQFHPESLCTPRGLELLDKFLESTA